MVAVEEDDISSFLESNPDISDHPAHSLVIVLFLSKLRVTNVNDVFDARNVMNVQDVSWAVPCKCNARVKVLLEADRI